MEGDTSKGLRDRSDFSVKKCPPWIKQSHHPINEPVHGWKCIEYHVFAVSRESWLDRCSTGRYWHESSSKVLFGGHVFTGSSMFHTQPHTTQPNMLITVTVFHCPFLHSFTSSSLLQTHRTIHHTHHPITFHPIPTPVYDGDLLATAGDLRLQLLRREAPREGGRERVERPEFSGHVHCGIFFEVRSHSSGRGQPKSHPTSL